MIMYWACHQVILREAVNRLEPRINDHHLTLAEKHTALREHNHAK